MRSRFKSNRSSDRSTKQQNILGIIPGSHQKLDNCFGVINYTLGISTAFINGVSLILDDED